MASTNIKAALDEAHTRYESRYPKSKALYEDALKVLPGGNTRSLLHTNPFPIIMKKGQNHMLIDEDGHKYHDFIGELAAGLFGHSNPLLIKALTDAANTVGVSLGATHVQEAKYTQLLCERFNLERIRFCNSGTEANLHALAAVKKFTGRRKVVTFKGGYHGSVLAFGATQPPTKEKVFRLGPAENNVDLPDWIVLKYNDVAGVRELLRSSQKDDIAAVLVEPMQGSGGAIPAKEEFLYAIQEECAKAKIMFVLDEVMTSRTGAGGIKSLFPSDRPLRPDITTLGKYLGGGMPIGAFGGREDVMAVYDPRLAGAMFHSGTFQNNTLMLHMGYTAISQVYTPVKAIEHTNRGDTLRKKLQTATKGSKLFVSGKGTLMFVHISERWGMSDGGFTCKEEGGDEEWDLKTLFWMHMLEEGFWVQRRGSIALILDTPQEVLDGFVAAVERFIERYATFARL